MYGIIDEEFDRFSRKRSVTQETTTLRSSTLIPGPHRQVEGFTFSSIDSKLREDSAIYGQGIDLLCTELDIEECFRGLSVTDSLSSLILFHKLRVVLPKTIMRAEWYTLFLMYRIERISDLKRLIKTWINDVSSSVALFTDVYDHSYDQLRGNSKYLDNERALLLWKHVFLRDSLIANFRSHVAESLVSLSLKEWLQNFFEWLQDNISTHGITRDVWFCTLRYFLQKAIPKRQTHVALSSASTLYDARSMRDSTWPSMFDDFEAWQEKKCLRNDAA